MFLRHTLFCICLLTFLRREASGQVICKDLTLSNGKGLDKPLQVGIVIETTKPKGVPKLVKWAKLVIDRIAYEVPAAKFALTSFADYPGKHGSDPEGCYTFHHKLTNNADVIKAKMDTLQATQHDTYMHSSVSAGLSFTAGDRRIGWDHSNNSYPMIIGFTSSMDSQLDNDTIANRTWAVGDGKDTCVKNKGCRAEGGFGSIYELIRTRTRLRSVYLFLAHEYALTYRALKRQIIRNILTERHAWIHACPANPPQLLKNGFDDPALETDCINNLKHMNKALVIMFSNYLQEMCNKEFNKIGQYRLKPYPPKTTPTTSHTTRHTTRRPTSKPVAPPRPPPPPPPSRPPPPPPPSRPPPPPPSVITGPPLGSTIHQGVDLCKCEDQNL